MLACWYLFETVLIGGPDSLVLFEILELTPIQWILLLELQNLDQAIALVKARVDLLGHPWLQFFV